MTDKQKKWAFWLMVLGATASLGVAFLNKDTVAIGESLNTLLSLILSAGAALIKLLPKKDG